MRQNTSTIPIHLPTRADAGWSGPGTARVRTGFADRLLSGSSAAATAPTLWPMPAAVSTAFRPASARTMTPPRKETRLQRLEAMIPCAMMVILCAGPRSVIPTNRRRERLEMNRRFQDAGDRMVSDLPLRDANPLAVAVGEVAGEVMWDFASPYAGARAVSPFTAALTVNLWLEDRLFTNRLQPDGTTQPDLSLEEGSIFHEGGPFANAWADLNELILGLPDCPFHDPNSLARIQRTARKLVGPMHDRLQARGFYLSKEISQ
jgi:hypothetical protein